MTTSIKLSVREKQVLELISKEYISEEIAQKLSISSETVKSHRRKLFNKLEARNMAGLMVKSIKHKFIHV